MANESIKEGFDRLWQHILAALSDKSSVGHAHEAADISDFQEAVGEAGGASYMEYGVATNAEIEAAYQKHKTLFCVYNGSFYPLLARVSGEEHIFGLATNDGWYNMSCVADEWSFYSHDFEYSAVDNQIAGIAINSTSTSLTVTNTFIDGETEQIVFTIDEQGHPTGVSYNGGDVIPIEWTEVSE